MIAPRAGLRFIHGYWIDHENQPIEYEISAIRRGVIYIRPAGGACKEKVGLDRWPVVCGGEMQSAKVSTGQNQ